MHSVANLGTCHKFGRGFIKQINLEEQDTTETTDEPENSEALEKIEVLDGKAVDKKGK
jgi:hypothetical protein